MIVKLDEEDRLTLEREDDQLWCLSM